MSFSLSLFSWQSLVLLLLMPSGDCYDDCLNMMTGFNLDRRGENLVILYFDEGNISYNTLDKTYSVSKSFQRNLDSINYLQIEDSLDLTVNCFLSTEYRKVRSVKNSGFIVAYSIQATYIYVYSPSLIDEDKLEWIKDNSTLEDGCFRLHDRDQVLFQEQD
ncbi:hypothetical protein [Phaeocystidibacter luteus]|uniref:Uncharacterized protein n=1 Tax=Phaeocystidibacter luteus TaxID=911197 RepID=A0A6N6RCZ9_9FLAO|nr:hypothetical protein [Phaeocystidibacter luteus]KAB2805372.1 hypothetical protein F8C67_13635 [Phaeocystidibacter luteus]